MQFLSWQLVSAYLLDLVLGDPRFLPHPIRWIGRFISRVEAFFYLPQASAWQQRVAGCSFWLVVVGGVGSSLWLLLLLGSHIHPYVGQALAVWLAYSTLATRSLHRESSLVAATLERGDLAAARHRLAFIVSRETQGLDEPDIVRGLIETVSENISDGIVAPLFYLALGGPLWAMIYKAVNTMDSMVGYKNKKYRYFGSFAARADDLANWIPARLTGLLLVGAAAAVGCDWRGAWLIMHRDGRKLASPNAGIPQAAAAGALGVRLGGGNIYFGQFVDKPRLGDARQPLTLDSYRRMVKLMYLASLMAFVLAVGVRALLVYLHG